MQMRKFDWIISILLISGLLLGTQNQVQAAPPPPTEEPQAIPQTEEIDQTLIDAFTNDVNTGAKVTGEVLAFVIYDPYIDHVAYSADGQTALLWLGLHDPQTGEVIAAEPGLAIAQTDESQKSVEDGGPNWEITQQADQNWQTAFESLPSELLSEDLIQRFSTPDDAIEKNAVSALRGYKLPWAGGLSKTLSGSIGHFKIYNSCSESNCRYAYDFADGTMFPLLAARGGTVFRVNTSCPNFETSCTNYLVLKDESTSPVTYQLYMHMAYNSVPSALRTIGTQVVQGQYIGNADDTGYSSGHHLHFHVHTYAASYWGSSVDFRFDDVSINDGSPRTCYEAETWPAYGSQCIQDNPNTSTNEKNKFVSGNYGAYPPTGDITSPLNGAEITQKSIQVRGWARDDIGIQKIEIIARGRGEDWKVVGTNYTMTGSSFVSEVNLCDGGASNGPLDIAARIYDLEGNLITGGMAGLRTIVNNGACTQVQQPACIPTANQVALYTDANYQGICALYGVTDYFDLDDTTAVGDNTVESVMVGSNVHAILYDSRDGRNETFEGNDANLKDNRVTANYVSGLKVELRSTLPQVPTINTIFNDFRRATLFSDESYVVDFSSPGATSFRAQLTGPVNKTLSETNQNGWSLGSLPAGSYSLNVWGKNSAGERVGNLAFNISDKALSNPGTVSAPVNYDFESGAQNWVGVPMWYSADRTLGTRTSKFWIFNDNYAGSSSSGGDIGDPNIGGADLTSQPIRIPGSGYYLRFDYYYQSESFYSFWDQRWVQISVDGGPFENLLQLSMDADNAWLTSQAINLTAYAGKTIRLRFHMDIVDRYYNGNYFGWAVDNVIINNTAPISCSDSEPNNSPSQAGTLAANSEVYAYICPGGDFDYYKLSLNQGDQVTLDVDAKDVGSSLDPYLFVFDSQGKLLLENDDEVYTVQRDSKIFFSPLTSGTYYAMVKAWDHPRAGSSSHFYTLKVSSGDLTSPTLSFITPGSTAIPSTLFPVQVSAADNGSGVKRVDFYWRSSDILNGVWELLGSDTNGADGWSANFNPSGRSLVTNSFLVAQAFDNSNNQRTVMKIVSGFDQTTPTSQLNPLPSSQGTTLITLSWTGSDPDGLVASYDLQVKVGSGSWTDLLLAIPASQTSASFFGETGKTYGFRLRAKDLSNNVEAYPNSAEATTTILTCTGDSFESADNSSSSAVLLPAGSSQNHNFCPTADVDWIKVNLVAGKEYMYMLGSRGGGAAMNVKLYASNGSTLLKEAAASGFGQSVVFKYKPTQTQVGYLKITPLDNRLAGNAVQYSVWYGVGYQFLFPLFFR
jgi:hypothetical protein